MRYRRPLTLMLLVTVCLVGTSHGQQQGQVQIPFDEFMADYEQAFEQLKAVYQDMELTAVSEDGKKTLHAYFKDEKYRVDYDNEATRSGGSGIFNPDGDQVVIQREEVGESKMSRIVSSNTERKESLGVLTSPFASSLHQKEFPKLFREFKGTKDSCTVTREGDEILVRFEKEPHKAPMPWRKQDHMGEVDGEMTLVRGSAKKETQWIPWTYVAEVTLLPEQSYAVKEWREYREGAESPKEWFTKVTYKGEVDGVPLLAKVVEQLPKVTEDLREVYRNQTWAVTATYAPQIKPEVFSATGHDLYKPPYESSGRSYLVILTGIVLVFGGVLAIWLAKQRLPVGKQFVALAAIAIGAGLFTADVLSARVPPWLFRGCHQVDDNDNFLSACPTVTIDLVLAGCPDDVLLRQCDEMESSDCKCFSVELDRAPGEPFRAHCRCRLLVLPYPF